ncbi:MAG: hypothetical protein HXS48_01905 [Theionarchaea archaeon]|nr:hypothetical protein [Theionarchaea archaeon]
MMSEEKYFIYVGCALLLSAFIVTSISEEMNFYDLVLIATTLTEKGILTKTVQRSVVILSIFGGISVIFGGIAYFFQMKTNESIEHIDEAQYSNFETIKINQDLIESMVKSFMEKSGSMQQQMMEKINALEDDLKEIKKIVEEVE